MKVTGHGLLQGILPPGKSEPRHAEPQRHVPMAPGDRIAISENAEWIDALKEELSRIPVIRPEAVAEARELIARGQLESSVDMDTLLDALLADL